jgi:hypothetical protein
MRTGPRRGRWRRGLMALLLLLLVIEKGCTAVPQALMSLWRRCFRAGAQPR